MNWAMTGGRCFPFPELRGPTLATYRSFLSMLVLILVFSSPTTAWEGHSVGFKLQDFRCAWHSLDDVRSSKLVVIAFLRTDCPLAGLYAPKLADLARDYEK